jgi:hypothetical protein
MSHHELPECDATTRRRLLVAGGSAMLAGMAGCSAIANAIGNRLLEDVNVLNQMNRGIGGAVEVLDPAGDTVLEEAFDLPPVEADGESNFVAYEDVWEDTGTYRVSVELPNTEIDGVARASETVRIDDTEEEMVAIALGSGEADAPIAVRVGESFSEFAWEE